jgi:hypothetical protein
MKFSDLKISVLIGLFAFLVYNLNGRAYSGPGDSVSARYLPIAIVNHGSIYLDPVRNFVIDRYPDPFWALDTINGHKASLFPIVTPAIISPLYIPGVIFLRSTGWTEDRVTALAVMMEKISASMMASIAVAFMYLALSRRGLSLANALILGLAFALATGTWSTSSQVLWLHAAAELLCALSIWLITGSPSKIAVFGAGLSIALYALNRTPDAIFAVGLGLPALVWSGRKWPLLFLGGLIPISLILAYNVVSFGNFVGAWALAIWPGHPFYRHDRTLGALGLLFSPTRGLFIFSPFLLLLPLGIWEGIRKKSQVFLTCCMVVALAAQIYFYSSTDWRAGFSYGPRYMIDYLPALIWLLAPALSLFKGVSRFAFVAMISFSVWVEYVGAFHYDTTSNHVMFKDNEFGFSGPLWNVENIQYLVDSKLPRQPGNIISELKKMLAY